MDKSNIYVGHARGYEDVDGLYNAFRNSILNREYNIILPHEVQDKYIRTKEFLKECKIMIAEVSIPATGLGIELGYANIYEVDIICIYKSGSKIAGSLNTITNKFIEYNNFEELIEKLENEIKLK